MSKEKERKSERTSEYDDDDDKHEREKRMTITIGNTSQTRAWLPLSVWLLLLIGGDCG